MTTAVTQKHETICVRGMATQKGRRTRFMKRYPNYCKTCGATGIVWYRDWEGILGDTLCQDCREKGLCPRCMTDTMVEKLDPSYIVTEHFYETCTICGWRGDDDYGDRYCLPRDPICVCDVED